MSVWIFFSVYSQNPCVAHDSFLSVHFYLVFLLLLLLTVTLSVFLLVYLSVSVFSLSFVVFIKLPSLLPSVCLRHSLRFFDS